MSYLEYTVKTVPAGWRKMLFINWPLVILLSAIAGVGFLMLYSVAGGSLTPWAEPQMKRFALGFTAMLVVALVPIWFWRNMAGVAFAGSLALLLAVEVMGEVGMGAQRWINLGITRFQVVEAVKLLIIIYVAGYLANRPALLLGDEPTGEVEKDRGVRSAGRQWCR